MWDGSGAQRVCITEYVSAASPTPRIKAVRSKQKRKYKGTSMYLKAQIEQGECASALEQATVS
jgi:hypothetical protein